MKSSKTKTSTRLKSVLDKWNSVIGVIVTDFSKGKPADTSRNFEMDEEKYKK